MKVTLTKNVAISKFWVKRSLKLELQNYQVQLLLISKFHTQNLNSETKEQS